MALFSSKELDDRLQEFVGYSELRQLAYNIVALQQEKTFHSLTVLSFLPGEGKTLFCAALAKAYGETCRTRVLVLDTTTFRNKNSLALRECFNGSAPQVDVKTLEQLRKGSDAASLPGPTSKTPALETEVVREKPAHVPLTRENDISLIKRTAEDPSRQYGLVLIDTAALQARNRSNIDPLLLARLSDASVVVVSRKLLESHNVSTSLKMLEDPALHLLGMISNEAHCP